MGNFEYCNGKLKKEYSPSDWAGEPEYMFVTKIHMSCGGGMGGSSWYEYVERLRDIPSNKIIKAKRYDGKEIFINTMWLVGAENFKLAKAVLDISKWENYYPNREKKKGTKVYYVLVDDDVELELL